MDSEDEIRGGNPCIFLILKFLNLIYGISALGLVALGIWLWIQFKSFDLMEIVFIALGIFEFILVMIAWTARKSVGRLKCYRFVMLILFVCELTITILGFTLQSSVIDKLKKDTDSETRIKQLEKYYDIVIYYVLGSLIIMILMVGLTQCYISSLKNRNFAYDYKVLDEEGRKITVDEKVRRDTQKVEGKYEKKREEMAEKYAGYKDYRLNKG